MRLISTHSPVVQVCKMPLLHAMHHAFVEVGIKNECFVRI